MCKEYKDDDLITSNEIAELAGVSKRTVRRWTDEGYNDIPYPVIETGRYHKWNYGEIKQWIEQKGLGV